METLTKRERMDKAVELVVRAMDTYGLSQQELANLIGVTPRAIRFILKKDEDHVIGLPAMERLETVVTKLDAAYERGDFDPAWLPNKRAANSRAYRETLIRSIVD